jgi:pumilio family protein 6
MTRDAVKAKGSKTGRSRTGKLASVKGGAKEVAVEMPAKKAKKQPVHLSVVAGGSSDEESFDEAEVEYAAGSEIEDEAEDEAEAGSEIENSSEHDVGADAHSGANTGTEARQKRPKTETRQEAKKLKAERQAHRPHADTVLAAKKLWEAARRRDLKAEERAAPLAALIALLRGKFKEMLLKHDASRMVQTCVKYASPADRLAIASELTGSFVDVAKSRYGKHIVRRLLQLCPAMRRTIAGEFRGRVTKVLRHVDGSSVLEALYTDYMNAGEKAALLLEFYGPEYVLFLKEQRKRKGSSTPAIPTLSEIVSKGPEKRLGALKYLREALDGLVNKNLFQHSLIHRLMLEYVTYAETSEVQDWISTLEDKFVEIVHTFEGARVVSRCLALATAKQRKALLKSFKPFAGKIAREEYGHQVLLTAFSVVDDTVLMKGSLVSELLKGGLAAVLEDKYASRVVLFLLASSGAAESYRHLLSAPTTLFLGDCVAAAHAAGTSKKEPANRAAELRADMVDSVAEHVTGKVAEFLNSPDKAAILTEAVLVSSPIFEELVEVVKSPAVWECVEARGLLKKIARRTNDAQAAALLEQVFKPKLQMLVAGEGVYVLVALLTAHPALSSQISMDSVKATTEHGKALLAKLAEFSA